MNDLNSVILEGNLTRNPKLKQTASGKSFCQFQIAVNRYYKKKEIFREEVSFFEIVTYDRLAETCAEYLIKGRGVRVVGRMKQLRWITESGEHRSKVAVIAGHVEFKPSKKKVGKNGK